MNILTQLDTQVFFFINHLPHSAFTNYLASLLSGLGEAGFIWFVVGIWLVVREERRDHRFFLPLGLGGVGSWLLSEVLLKMFIERLRPSSVLDAAIVVGGFPLGYSFPSTHATFAFALATILVYKERRWTRWLYGLAWLIALSRIYLGYHYPSDVIAGGLLGWGIGTFVIWWYQRYQKSTHENHSLQVTPKRKKQKHRV